MSAPAGIAPADPIAVDGIAAAFDRPLAPGFRLLRWSTPVISLCLFAVAAWRMHGMDLHHLVPALPRAPMFWIALIAAYLALPVSEWVIYRRLWGLPPSGIVPLLRKHVSNEVLLGYSGEVYFYAWARRRMAFAGAPFGAVKDVAVLSAQAGNVATLVMLAAAWPYFGMLPLGGYERDVLLSALAAIGLSLPVFLLRRMLFTAPARELRMILAIHGIRIVAVMLCTALAWRAASPGAAIGLWLLLTGLRQLVSRLPLMPNKDLAFAALVMFLLGAHSGAADVIAISASVMLCIHLLLGVALGAAELLGAEAGAELQAIDARQR